MVNQWLNEEIREYHESALAGCVRVRFPAHLFDRMVKLAHAKGLTVPEVLGRAFLSYESDERVKARWLDEARERQERLGGGA